MGNAHSDGTSSEAGGSIARGDPRRPKITAEEAAHLPLIPHYVYAVLAEHVYQQPTRRPIPDGWRVLVSCDELHLAKEGYFATAYVNDRLRHCIIAERGTSDALGLRAGVWIYFDEPTIQFSLAEQFSKLVRLRLSLTRAIDIPTSGSTPYYVSYTGHSLGAVLAACRAVAEHTYAITFESPGCRAFVEKTMHPFKAEDVDIITYQRAPNPINTLRPHTGYLVQLPYVAPPPTTRVDPTIVAKPGWLSFSLPNPQDLRNKLLLKGVPELQMYLAKVEPILREMLNHTQLSHSMASIVSNFENEDEPPNQDVVLAWPSHVMQFLEYYNIVKAMEDPSNQERNVYQAYENLLQRFYMVAKRPKNKIPLRFLNKDSQKLLRLWWDVLKPSQLEDVPISWLEKKALNTTELQGDCMVTNQLTAFQMKMLLSMAVSRSEVRSYLDNFTFDALIADRAKL